MPSSLSEDFHKEVALFCLKLQVLNVDNIENWKRSDFMKR